jgi:hypothetical protein
MKWVFSDVKWNELKSSKVKWTKNNDRIFIESRQLNESIRMTNIRPRSFGTEFARQRTETPIKYPLLQRFSPMDETIKNFCCQMTRPRPRPELRVTPGFCLISSVATQFPGGETSTMPSAIVPADPPTRHPSSSRPRVQLQPHLPTRPTTFRFTADGLTPAPSMSRKSTTRMVTWNTGIKVWWIHATPRQPAGRTIVYRAAES